MLPSTPVGASSAQQGFASLARNASQDQQSSVSSTETQTRNRTYSQIAEENRDLHSQIAVLNEALIERDRVFQVREVAIRQATQAMDCRAEAVAKERTVERRWIDISQQIATASAIVSSFALVLSIGALVVALLVFLKRK